MNILFIHQNFPGQFKHLAKNLAENKGNRVIALRIHQNTQIEGVEIYHYPIINAESPKTHPLVKDFETKVRRAESVAAKAKALRLSGFNPDIIIAHSGWGETFFLRDIWPNSKIIAYLEYYYRFEGQDVNFDPEFQVTNDHDRYRIRLKNQAVLHSLDEADAFITPTKWQYKQFPKWSQKRINIIHDGIDMAWCKANATAQVTLKKFGITLTANDEVITYVSRGLEPLRGFHQFMRIMPCLVERHPKIHILIIGHDIPAYETQKFVTYKEQLLHQLSDQLNPQQVHFLGKVPYTDYRQILQISSVHIYLTYPFIISWSLLEAMAIQCPIVASKTGPVTEYIQHNKNGLLVDFFDSEALSEAISQLLLDSALRKRLGIQARKTIAIQCNLTHCLKKQRGLIKQLTGERNC
jgi:glycosyltransferase involved in cell wall biosynthesis